VHFETRSAPKKKKTAIGKKYQNGVQKVAARYGSI